ncbi:MAG: thiamine pyrophosphate-dependent enzyme [Thermoanaerobaculia bacterium]|nr:thiamine pyrophosphate-dependent enzyme [Thermoanaerobaculia bacterium]
MAKPTGGDLVAEVLKAQGTEELFTLCGGHISPILVSSQQRGIRVVDVRHEVTAAFAADAVSRLTGRPGVVAVTAGPGVTNTVTAVKNAQMAQSPLVLLGGATGTILEGRGSLQDIDQMALLEPHVKWLAGAKRVKDLVPVVEMAFEEARIGVPGPAFAECPVDLLYAEELVRKLYGVGPEAKPPKSLGETLLRKYLELHLWRLFRGSDSRTPRTPPELPIPRATGREVRKVVKALRTASKPVMLVGSQATLRVDRIEEVAAAVDGLGIPVYLSGMARGLLGSDAERKMRHKRSRALRDADLVILAGVPCDFRLDYGRHIPRRAVFVSVNLSEVDLMKNRRPAVPVLADPGLFLVDLAAALGEPVGRADWVAELRRRDQARDDEIAAQGEEETEYVNPIHLFREMDKVLDDDSILVADGGDFVATASYILRPRGPLRWLDPGAFGTLGVGGGFALGAKCVRPDSEVWLIWGDGSAAYSIAEFDTFARHGLPIIAVVGNDGSWAQIAREQVEILGDATGTVLERNDYHVVAEGWGGKGFLLERPGDVSSVLQEAKEVARAGTPVLINCKIGATDFRKGSISM